MKTAYEMLLEIKKYPSLFIRGKSFTRLMLYMDAYMKCLTELFAGREKHILDNFDFGSFVKEYFGVCAPNHNWREVLLYQSHEDENAFDIFYKVLDAYLKKNPNIQKEEYERQEKYHQLQLNTDLEKIPPTNDYSTVVCVLDCVDDSFLEP